MQNIKVYSEEDKQLINNAWFMIPDDPCDECGPETKRGCAGCPKKYEEERAWKRYKEAGIDDVARDVKKRKQLQDKIQRIEKEIADINKRLPDFVEGGEVKTDSRLQSMLMMAEGNKQEVPL